VPCSTGDYVGVTAKGKQKAPIMEETVMKKYLGSLLALCSALITIAAGMLLMVAILVFCDTAWGEMGGNDMKIGMNATEFEQIFTLGDKNDAYAQYFIGQS
jgi:hypothetical protein